MRTAPVLCLLTSLVPSLAAQGYLSGFETLTASTTGTPAAGQDGYYIPPVTGTLDGAFYTYAGNTIGVPANPNGGAVFYAGNAGVCRSQRNVSPPTNGRCIVQADICPNFIGAALPANNIGGLSLQPSAVIAPQFPTAATFSNLIVAYTQVTAAPFTWTLQYALGPTLAGVVTTVPDPAFTNLPLNQWYTIGCTIDFRTGEYINIFIVNGSTRTVYTPPPATPLANQIIPAIIPTDFRLFTGNTGNQMCFDNVKITWGAGYESFGTGCAGSMGIPSLTAAPGSSPQLGTTFSTVHGNLPMSIVVNITGFSNTLAVGSIPLPFNLAPQGFPGCTLLVDPLVTQLIIGSANTATWNLTIPNNTVYLGTVLFNQGASLQAAAPGLAFGTGGRAVVGL